MLADDFLGSVALDVLSPGVPGDNPSIDIQRQDRIVTHPVHQELEQVFPLAPIQMGLAIHQLRAGRIIEALRLLHSVSSSPYFGALAEGIDSQGELPSLK